MAKIANVASINTFDTWRSRSNASFDRLSQFAVNNSSLYANTITANVAFTSTGLATLSGRATVGTNLTVSGNTSTNKATVTSALTVSGNTTLGAAGKTITTTGAAAHTGTQSISTNLTVSGNTTINGSTLSTTSATLTAFAGATTLLTLGGTGASAVLAIPSTLEQSSTTGALTVAGGVYIAKKLNVAGVATLATGAVLGTPASGTVTNLTGTASININGTVGATTPAAGTFTTLSATGITTVAAGSAALPAIVSTTGTADTGLWFPAADTVAASTAGTERLRIDSSGNVGIGTTTLTNKFNVAGAIQSSSTLVAVAANTVALSQESGYSRLAAFGPDNSTGGVLYLYSISANGSVQNGAVIDASGNVGVGTTSPSTYGKLAVSVGNSSFMGATTSSGSSGGAGGWQLNSYYGSVKINYIDCELTNGTPASETSVMRFATIGSGTLAESMRIDSSGNLLVGTTGNSPSAKLFSVTSSNWGLFAQCGNGNSAIGTTNTSGTASYTAVQFYNNGTTFTAVGNITVSGSATAYNTSSDYRLKNTIAPMTGALDKVALLKPVTYKWNVDNSDGQGFIAHELAEVEPNCVTGEKDATREEEYEVTPAVPAVVDADGVETTPAVQAVKGTRTVPSYQGVDTSFLVATLTAAIQELKAIIDTQATRIAALEAKA